MEFFGNGAAVLTTVLIGLGFAFTVLYLFIPIISQLGIAKKTRHLTTSPEFDRKDGSRQSFLQKHQTNTIADWWIHKQVGFSNTQGLRASRAKFDNEDLHEQDFHDSEMPDVSFEGSDLKKANFIHSNLWHANFRNCELVGADFTEADLQDADLRGANLEAAKLEGTRLKGAIFNGSTRLPFPEEQARGKGMVFVAS